ncbi:MAG TPA: glycosyltransferase family 39 protein [Polyangia bacterium]|nr:glycosyltransferase family 39 protein [Polyangia bacterium]
MLLLSLGFLLLSLVAYGVLEDFPNSADEYAYVFQAETFRHGRLWNPLPPATDFFRYNHLIEKDGKFLSRFPPGWPLVLAVASALAVPRGVVSSIVGVLSLAVLYRIGRRLYGAGTGLLACFLLLPSAFFLFTNASYFSHAFCALTVLLFIDLCLCHRADRRPVSALSAGLCLGLCFATRYYTALLAGLPVALAFAAERRWRSLLLLGLGGSPIVVLLGLYNTAITGHPLLMVTTWYDPAEVLGFTNGHSLRHGLHLLVGRLLLFMRWTAPTMLPLYLVLCMRRPGRRTPLLYPVPFIAIALGYVFFWSSGSNQYGPRFYYEGYPLVVLFVTSQLVERRPLRGRAVLVSLLLAGQFVGLGTTVYLAVRQHRVVEERLDLYRQVEAAHLADAIVFIASGTGVLSEMPIGDLTRNGLDFTGSVLYAWDRGPDNRRLMAQYPTRRFYRYVRAPRAVHGQLLPVTGGVLPSAQPRDIGLQVPCLRPARADGGIELKP